MKRTTQIRIAQIVFLWGLFFVALPTVSQAAFQDSGWGARPVGMAGAFSAISDDTNASLYNPAGLVQVQWNEASAMYAQLFTGLTLYSGQDTTHLDQNYLAFASKPIPHFGSWGFSWARFAATNLYSEDTYTFSYARVLGDFFPSLDGDYAVGVNLKYLQHKVTLDSLSANDPVFTQGSTSAGAFTADLGALYKPDHGALAGLRISAVVQNITRPDVGFQATDRVPMKYTLGTAYQSKQMPWLVPDIDFTYRDGITEVLAGAESWLFNDALGLRTGVNRDQAAAGISYYQAIGQKTGFRLDYGFTVPFFVEGTSGSHRIALTVYF